MKEKQKPVELTKEELEAIYNLVKEYEESFLEPELRPEYLENLEKIRKGKYIKFNSIDELRKITS